MMGSWEEQAVLQASDRRSGDRFGATLALDQVAQWSSKSTYEVYFRKRLLGQITNAPPPMRKKGSTEKVVSQ